MNRYKEYKDSDIDWIGKVPASWRITPAKALFSKRTESEKPDDVHLTPSQKFGVLPQEQYIEVSGSKPMLKLSSAGSMRHVEPGDFIIHLRSFQGGLELSPFEGKVSAAYTVVTPRKRETQRYFRWLFKSAPYISKLASLTSQLRDGQNITYGTFALIKLPFPPDKEQTAIADYLDAKTAEIDGVVEKLQRQRELLERYKRELIAHTVTRGLNPDAPMKDSGLEWIGKVPKHWQIQTLSNMTDENKTKNKDLTERNLLSLSYGLIIRKDIDLAFGLLPASFESYQIVESGYIILRMTDLQNDKRSLRTGHIQERGIITGAYIGLIPRSQVVSQYLGWLLRTYDLKKIFYCLGSGVRQSLNYSQLRTLPTLLPPLDEQRAIATHLDAKTSEIDGLVSGIDRQVELLQKYRKQLINDVVTGKVRVCEEDE